jgi:protein-S-isoprenylcysteine O-methyltransferase Ste14
MNDNTVNKKDVTKRMTKVVFLLLLTAAILFAASGNLSWIWGWVYIIIYILYIIINGLVLSKELIAERGKQKKNVKGWDKTLNGINSVFALSSLAVAGLDERFSWTGGLNTGLHILGMILFIGGSFLFTWSMVSNTFFSTMVRIQNERGHKVASGGPYKFVRHPGYTGFILTSFGVPLILGSLWALIPAAATAVTFVVRTALEDRTLLAELDGYREFSEKTRYRLIPGIW